MSKRPPELSAELRSKILGSLAKDAAPTRSAWQRRSAIALSLGIASSVALFVGIGAVQLGDRPATYVASLGAAWLVLLLAASPWVLMRGRSSVGRSSRLLARLSFGIPLLVLGLVAGAALIWPETRTITSDRSDVRCFGVGLLLGAGPYVSVLWIKRRLVLVHAQVEAAAAGVFAGTAGALLITLRCDCSELSHLIIGHLLPVLALGALSALLAGRWLARAPLRG